jgi:hypothetical protein
MLEVHQGLRGSCKLLSWNLSGCGVEEGCVPSKVDPVGEKDSWFEGAPPCWPIHLF